MSLQRLVGVNASGQDGVLSSGRKIGRLETCTHLSELLGPAVITLYQTVSYGKPLQRHGWPDNQLHESARPFFYRWLLLLANPSWQSCFPGSRQAWR